MSLDAATLLRSADWRALQMHKSRGFNRYISRGIAQVAPLRRKCHGQMRNARAKIAFKYSSGKIGNVGRSVVLMTAM